MKATVKYLIQVEQTIDLDLLNAADDDVINARIAGAASDSQSAALSHLRKYDNGLGVTDATIIGQRVVTLQPKA